MLLTESTPSTLFALVALPEGFSENVEMEPQELTRVQGLEEAWAQAAEYFQAGGFEAITLHEVLPSGRLEVAEACYMG
jgi:hypothetical protein